MKKLLSGILAVCMLVSATSAMAAPGKKPGKDKENNKPGQIVTQNSTEVGYYVSFMGIQFDEEGNIETRDTSYFSDRVGKAELNKKLDNKFAIALGENVTEDDILSYVDSVPEDDDVFALLVKEFENTESKLSTSSGEEIAWTDLDDEDYEIEWYVLKRENDHWHIDGRIHEIGSDEDIIIVPPPVEEEDDEEEEEIIVPPPAEEEDDPQIILDGVDYAYIFGYEPEIKTVDGVTTAEIRMGMDDKVTVEQVSSMLMRLLDQHGDTTDVIYPMVPAVEPHKGTWYERGLLYLCSVGGFDINKPIVLTPITRGKVAKLVACALNLTKSTETSFTDIADSEYKDYIEIVYNYGYMNGMSEELFAPDEYMTRAEFCSLFNNIIDRNSRGLIALDENGEEYEVTAEMYYFVDMNPEHWAYEICLKATSAYNEDGYVDTAIRLSNIRNKLDHYDSQILY